MRVYVCVCNVRIYMCVCVCNVCIYMRVCVCVCVCIYAYRWIDALCIYTYIFTWLKDIENLHDFMYLLIYNPAIGLMSRMFTNSLGDQVLIPGQVIPKTQKIVLDSTLLSTQYYKVRIKGKVEQSWEWRSALHYTMM